MSYDGPINVALLRKQLEFATAHPEQHDQSKWVAPCGTYGCIAGNTVLHTEGYQLVYPSADSGLAPTVQCPDGRVTFIRVAACDLLGLTFNESEAFFDANATLGKLWRLASVYTKGEIEVPPEFELPIWPKPRFPGLSQ